MREREREREREKCKAAKSDKIAKEKIEGNRPRDSFLPGGEGGKVQASEMTADMIYDSSLFSRLGITSGLDALENVLLYYSFIFYYLWLCD